MQVQQIADAATVSDPVTMGTALSKMRSVPEHELHFYLVMRDTLNTTSADTRKAITLAQVELDRRTANQTRRLTIMTTLMSGVVGIIGVLLGAYLGKYGFGPLAP